MIVVPITFVAIVIVAPPVPKAALATVARLFQLMPVVDCLPAVGPVTIHVMVQPVFPFIYIPAALSSVIIRARRLGRPEHQNSTCQSYRQRRMR